MYVCRRRTTCAAFTLGQKLGKLCLRELAFAARPHRLRSPGQHHLQPCTRLHAPAYRSLVLLRHALCRSTRAEVLECRNNCREASSITSQKWQSNMRAIKRVSKAMSSEIPTPLSGVWLPNDPVVPSTLLEQQVFKSLHATRLKGHGRVSPC